MMIGVLRVKLRLPENQSLKGKRQVIKSLIARLHNRFHVSAAEVANNDSWQLATIGVAVVSNDERHADEVLGSIMDYIGRERLDAEILDYETEIIDAGAE
jgi:uncharacterized protein YlxP (DUF503 family)